MAEQVEFNLLTRDESSANIEKVKGGFAGLKESATQAGLAFGSIAAIGGAMIKGWVDNAMEAQRTSTQLDAVLKSTGGASGLTAEAVKGMAGELAKVTTIGDDTILTGQNMLLTFTNIGKDVFPKATETMLDMATAMNGGVTPSAESLKGTAIQLGKALNDPTKGMTALTKVGVTFTEAQKKQIEVMQKSGDIMGAQKVILAELSKEFGGSARAAALTFGGQMENLNNRIGEIGETLGGYVIPVLATFGEWLGQLVSWFEKLDEPTKQAIANTALLVTGFAAVGAIIGGLIAVMSPVILVVGAISLAVGALYFAWQTNFGGIKDTTKVIFDWLKNALKELWNYFEPTFRELFTKGQIVFQAFAKFIKDHWIEISTTFTVAWDLIKAGFSFFWEAIKLIAKVAWDVLSGSIKFWLDVLNGDWSAAWKDIEGIFKGVWDDIASYIKGIVDTIISTINQIISAVSSAISAMKSLSGGGGGGTVGGSVKARAAGGDFSPGDTLLVGEEGPEVLQIGSTGGYVTPNNKLNGGGKNITIINHFSGHFSSKEMAREYADVFLKDFQLSTQAN